MKFGDVLVLRCGVRTCVQPEGAVILGIGRLSSGAGAAAVGA